VTRAARVEMIAEHGAVGGEREIVTADGRVRVPLVGGLGSGRAETRPGPGFVEAPDTTIFVPAGWSIEFTEHGYGVLTREEAS
jgi:N-methylhydantoinase A/oxoprolinase/acetone carboxylase beta subunit